MVKAAAEAAAAQGYLRLEVRADLAGLPSKRRPFQVELKSDRPAVAVQRHRVFLHRQVVPDHHAHECTSAWFAGEQLSHDDQPHRGKQCGGKRCQCAIYHDDQPYLSVFLYREHADVLDEQTAPDRLQTRCRSGQSMLRLERPRGQVGHPG